MDGKVNMELVQLGNNVQYFLGIPWGSTKNRGIYDAFSHH